MDVGKKFITLTLGIFISGIVIGTVCGIGIREIFGGKPAETGSKQIVSDLRGISSARLYPNHPVALWDKDAKKYRTSAAIEQLYGSWKEQESLTLSDIKSPYKLVVFESPVCPVCFAMYPYLRGIRRMFAKEELEILIIDPPALSERSAEKAVSTVRGYLASADEAFKKAYITQDRNDFRYVSLAPEDHGKIVQMLHITDIPYMLVLDDKMRIIYRMEGYPSGGKEEHNAFTRALNALLEDIRTELNQKKENPVQ